MAMEAVSAVRRAIEAGSLIPAGSTVVVAASGGIDSTVLLDVLARLARRERWRLVVAHLDHGLRAAGARDQRFVHAQAKARALLFRGGKADVVALRRREKGGLAAVARTVRYEFLAAVAAAEGATVIATAHTASDQAETVLLRLLRGTGAVGLGAIPSRRRLVPGVDVVRPLLALTRADVEAHAKRFALEWREDPSNKSPSRARNRIRHEVMPLLATFQPDVERVIARAATQAASAARVVKHATRRALDRARIGPPGKVGGELRLRREALLKLRPEMLALVVRRALADVRGAHGVTAAHVESACAIARRGRGSSVVAGAVVEVSKETLLLRAARVSGLRDPRRV